MIANKYEYSFSRCVQAASADCGHEILLIEYDWMHGGDCASNWTFVGADNVSMNFPGIYVRLKNT